VYDLIAIYVDMAQADFILDKVSISVKESMIKGLFAVISIPAVALLTGPS
jgi:hypothetical protein